MFVGGAPLLLFMNAPPSQSPIPGSRSYLHQEVVAFRKLMGQRSFWENQDRSRRALGGLFYTWMTMSDTEVKPSDNDLIRSLVEEFERRSLLVALGPKSE